MTTWDMKQVDAVRRLYADMHVDQVQLAAAPSLDHIRHHAAAAIVDMAHTHAVEVSRDDVAVIRSESNPATGETALRLAWSPGWRNGRVQVEFRSGARDGQVVTVDREKIWSGILAPVLQPAAWIDEADEVATISAVERYDVVGWREVERRWVMACR
jgi:hypothetical protein